jgi:hypothetical protein
MPRLGGRIAGRGRGSIEQMFWDVKRGGGTMMEMRAPHSSIPAPLQIVRTRLAPQLLESINDAIEVQTPLGLDSQNRFQHPIKPRTEYNSNRCLRRRINLCCANAA